MTIPTLFKLHHTRRVIALLVLSLVAIVVGAPHAGLSQAIRTKEETARIVAVEKVSVADGVVSGEVINRSPNVIRDVQLLVRYTWLWDNETKPGKNDPGTSAYYTLPKEIPPDGRLPFTYKPSPPLSKMAGGHFETSVSIGGFTEVIAQTR